VAADACPYVRAAFGNAEKLFLVKVVLWIIAIFLVRPIFWRSPFFISVFLLSAAGIYLLVRAHREGQSLREVLRKNVILRVPSGAGKEKREPFPRMTFALVMLMVLLYYVIEKAGIADAESIRNNLVFLPLRVRWWNLLASPFPSIFLHGSAAQLWTSAVFLWIFGPELEERIGGKKIFFLFIFSALAGKIIAVFAGLALFHESYHGWGASPAVAGIMGVFLVRCYFLKPALRLPLPGTARSKLRVNPLLPLGLFFILDLNAGFIALARDDSAIGQWTHFLSLAAGMLLALSLDLHSAAAEEKFIADGTAIVDHLDFFRGGESFLRAALEQNPENEAALLGLARLKSAAGPEESRDLFQHAIRSALRSSPERAARLFREYFQMTGPPLEPDLVYRLSAILYQEGDHDTAARSLEKIVDRDSGASRLRERAFLQLISILAENSMYDAASFRLRQFAKEFPRSKLLAGAREKCRIPE
jgi:membrane associated rhomboid family serine protease